MSAALPSSNRLFWKISGTLLLLLALLGVGYFYISSYIAQQYYQESIQRLHSGLAENSLTHVKPYIKGEISEGAIKDYLHSAMVINPNVEIYILDEEGNIRTHAAPKGKVKLKKVDLNPIRTFVAAKEKPYILGQDPRHPGSNKVFSAARIMEADHFMGYLYIILQSEEQAAVSSGLFDSYILKLGANLFLLTLVAALVIGLLAIWLLTSKLRNIIQTVRRFKEGDYKARIADEDKSDLPLLSNTFNEMAFTIENNIEQLKAIEVLRRELIANVSHDLRTPLSIMRGYVETLLMKEETISKEERTRYLHIVLNSSEKLSKLVSQLFEYSKLEANQIQPKKEAFFISELVSDIFEKYQIIAKEKGITIALDVPKKLPLVFADVALVERVLQNLIDNALKFTPRDGSVILELKALENDVEIRISDTGQGISEEEQSYIFERYHKATGTGKSKGAGLGLAIVKKILEIHNAKIQVQSKPNQGASFWFSLPVFSLQS